MYSNAVLSVVVPGGRYAVAFGDELNLNKLRTTAHGAWRTAHAVAEI